MNFTKKYPYVCKMCGRICKSFLDAQLCSDLDSKIKRNLVPITEPMTTLITRISNCKTGRQCDRIIEENIESLNDSNRVLLCKIANNRKKHIVSLQRMKKRNWLLADQN